MTTTITTNTKNQLPVLLVTLEVTMPAPVEFTPQAESFLMTAVPPAPLSLELLSIDATVAYASALKRIDEIADLGQNWDSYDSAPPSQSAVSAARSLLWRVFEIAKGVDDAIASPFSIAPLSGGGLQMEWRRGKGAIEVEINAEGKLGYLLIRSEEEGRSFEEADDAPDYQILALISSVVSGK